VPFVDLPTGARLYYEVHGPPSSATPKLGSGVVVFAHGAGGNHLSWWQQVPHLRDRATCLTYDHRGWGLSPGPPDGARLVDDLRALLDHLGVERASLVAQSMGGWACLGFALRHPDRVERLLLCDTHGGLTTPGIGPPWAESARLTAALPPGVHPALGERIYREQPALAFLYEEVDALNTLSRPEIFATVQAAGTVAPGDVTTLTIPITLLYGEEDIVIPPPFLDAAAAALPGARVVRIPAAGHSAYFERAQAFNAALDEFCKQSNSALST
jgi:3-oxoadipate enol-lactonase